MLRIKVPSGLQGYRGNRERIRNERLKAQKAHLGQGAIRMKTAQ